MDTSPNPASTSRPVLPWAVVFLASVLALQLAHVHQVREPVEGREAPGRSAAFAFGAR